MQLAPVFSEWQPFLSKVYLVSVYPNIHKLGRITNLDVTCLVTELYTLGLGPLLDSKVANWISDNGGMRP